MTWPLYIIVNTTCHEGKGLEEWLKAQEQGLNFFPQAKVVISENSESTTSILKDIPFETKTILISAGGDGAINLLINSIMGFPSTKKKNIVIGAVGLGSSNDFLKPFSQYLGETPIRINAKKTFLNHDLVKVNYLDEHNLEKQKYFIINSSFGVTALGNWNFNHPSSLLSWLKKVNTNLAINYTAATTILDHRNFTCTVHYNAHSSQMNISNINLLKNPYFSGSLFYDQQIEQNDGKIGINICRDMNKWELFKTVLNLENGKFQQTKKQISVKAGSFHLKSKTPIIMECDGETEKILEAEFSILKSEFHVMQA